MAHRLSKEERIKAIRDIPDLPGGPMWRILGPKGRAIPLISIGARELAILAIKHEEMVGLADKPGHDLDKPPEGFLVESYQSELGLAYAIDEEPKPKRKKRKVSDYSKQFGIILKALKKKHSRTPITSLMEKAHRKTRTEMKKIAAKKTGKLSKGRRVIAKSGQFRRDKILPRK